MTKALNLDNILPNILIFLMNIKYAIRSIKKNNNNNLFKREPKTLQH